MSPVEMEARAAEMRARPNVIKALSQDKKALKRELDVALAENSRLRRKIEVFERATRSLRIAVLD